MELIMITPSEEMLENNDYRGFIGIKVNGVKKFYVSDGEPEDSNLGRDFSDCFSVLSLMEMAFEAGKNGEELSIRIVEADDFDYDIGLYINGTLTKPTGNND